MWGVECFSGNPYELCLPQNQFILFARHAQHNGEVEFIGLDHGTQIEIGSNANVETHGRECASKLTQQRWKSVAHEALGHTEMDNAGNWRWQEALGQRIQ